MDKTPFEILKELWTPNTSGGLVVQSNAPGTNERDILHEGADYNTGVEVSAALPRTPEPWKRERAYGPGPSGTLGYADHGDPVRIAKRLHEQQEATRQRFPDVQTHGRPGPLAPEFNTFYDVFKSTEAFDKCILATASGQWVVGTTTIQSVVLNPPSAAVGGSPLSPVALFSQFPGSVQVFPVLLMFSFGQSVATATGEYSMAFVPQAGDTPYPLGEYFAGTASVYNTMRHIIRAPFTDPGQVNMGNIVITSNTVTGTPTIFWRMGFGFAAFLPTPAFKTSEPLRVRDWITAAPEPMLQRTPHGLQEG